MQYPWAFLQRHGDVLAGLIVWVIVGRLAPEGWGFVGLAAGVGAYFLVQRLFPVTKG